MMRKRIMTAMLLCTASMGALQAQQLRARTEVIDCGQVLFRQPVTAEFEIESDADTRISQVRPACGCTRVTDLAGRSVASGKPLKLQATYDAKQMGHFDKVIGVYAEGKEEPLLLHLKGVVVEEVRQFEGNYTHQLGGLKADKLFVEFEDVTRGDMPVQTIHIENPSSFPVSPVVMHLPAWLKAEVSPSTIATGRTGVIRLMADTRKMQGYGLSQGHFYVGMNAGEKVSRDKEVGVSAILLPSFQNLTESQLEQAPQLRLSTTNLNLGAFDGKSKKTGTIILENVGRTTLEISSLQLFAPGLKIALSKSKLEAGEEAKLKITAEQKTLRGQNEPPRVLMITNDPGQTKVIINVNVGN